MSHRVLIIGGGIAGLATAIALKRLGISCHVFEKAAGPSEIGAGITLWSNAMMCLRALGVADTIAGAGTPVIAGELRDRDGRALVRTPVKEVSNRLGEPSIAIHRALLVDILTRAAGSDVISYESACTGVNQTDEEITASFSDGRTETGSVLIGADGLRSVVLAELFGALPLRYTGHTCFRGVAALSDDRLAPGNAFEWAPRMRFGAIRLGDQNAYWFANLDSPAGWTPADAKTWLLQTFSSWHDPIRDLIERTDPRTILQHDMYDRPPHRAHWGKGRATLVGDACHPMTPNLGQGGCQALEDAIALANALHRSRGVDVGALREYESERYPRAAGLVKKSWQQGWISQRPTKLECSVRNFCTRLVPESVMTSAFRKLITISPPQLGDQ